MLRLRGLGYFPILRYAPGIQLAKLGLCAPGTAADLFRQGFRSIFSGRIRGRSE